MVKRKRSRMYLEEGGQNEILGTRRGIGIIFLFAMALVSFLSLFGLAGKLGEIFLAFFVLSFGWGKFLFPLALFFLVYLELRQEKKTMRLFHTAGLIIFLLSFLGIVHLFVPVSAVREVVGSSRGGGYVGLWVSSVFFKISGFWGSLILLGALWFSSLILIFDTSLDELIFAGKKVFLPFQSLIQWAKKDEVEEEEEENNEEEEDDEESDGEEDFVSGEKKDETIPQFDTRDIRKKMEIEEKIRLTQGALPSVSAPISRGPYSGIPMKLLKESPVSAKPLSVDVKRIQDIIQITLQNFGIDSEMGEVFIGPSVTQYTLRPLEAIKLSKITTLHNELALALAAHPIRIEAPIPGKSLVGIEVPNKSTAIVSLREMLESPEFLDRKGNLAISLGKDVSGKVWVANLETMPHCLIAGSTGSGKTVCINTVIMSLIFQHGPEHLKFIMIDPKRVELPQYNGIPHLLTTVITDVEKTVNALKWAVHEMERRFDLLSKFGKRNIQTYNKVSEEPLPYIVIIIDELADLMSTSSREVEGVIIRLAQMARAVGIHLILATQRPSVDIITGLIKANFPSRIAFSVASLVDSRTILDISGAERLLGRGDMLYLSAELSRPKRLQGAFVSDEEIQRVVDYLKRQGMPQYNENILQKQFTGGNSFDSIEGDDPLLFEAKKIIFEAGKASASLLQRRLRVGYSRAARLLDLLEAQGIIGPSDGAKPRDVFLTSFDENDQFTREIKPMISEKKDHEVKEGEYVFTEEDNEGNSEMNIEEDFNEEEYLSAQQGEYLEEDHNEKK